MSQTLGRREGTCFLSTYKATLMNETAVGMALVRIAHEIVEKNRGCENLCLVGIKRRGIPLAETIAKNIETITGTEPLTGAVDVTFYRDDLTKVSENPCVEGTAIDFDINGKIVVLVDDVLFTGRTARAAMEAIMQRGRPSRIQLVVLIDRGHRELPIRGDFVGKNVPTARAERIEVKIPPYDDRVAVELYG